MRLIALQEFDYAGKRRNPGDEFDVSNPIHGALLVQGGRVKEKQKLETRIMKSEEPAKHKEPERQRKQRYPNRMMVSED